MPDPNALKLVKELGRPEVLFSIARVPNTNRLFVGAASGKILDVDPLAEKPEFKELDGHTSYVTGLVLCGNKLISGSYDCKLLWRDIESGQVVKAVENAHAKWIRGLTQSPDGKLVASVADDMACKLWNAESGDLVKELNGHQPKTPQGFPSMLFTCAFSADGKLLATADKVGHVVVWDVEQGKQLAAVEAPLMYTWDPKQRIHSIGGVRSVAFSPDGKLLAIGGTGQIGNIDHLEALARLEVFDWQKNERTCELPGDTYKGLVERIAFDPTGKWFVCAGGDSGGFIKFIDPAEKKVLKQDKAPMTVHGFVLNEAFDTLYAAGHGRIAVWEFKG